jgi:FkbM family methyltransferase
VRVNGLEIIIADVPSFLSAYKNIFVNRIYAFNCQMNSRPVILDCGANIGVSVLFFKKIFPDCRVIAYEADPRIFAILSRNIQLNKIEGVELLNKAIWSSEKDVAFLQEGADAGRISSGHSNNEITIPAVPLNKILAKNKFDLVKIDIEGAEIEAFKDCSTILRNADKYFIEFHSFHGKPQHLGSLISLFEQNGFRVQIHPEHYAKHPFLSNSIHRGMDLQLNLYFIKE